MQRVPVLATLCSVTKKPRPHSGLTGIKEIALVTDSFQNQKQKPPNWLPHKAVQLTSGKLGMTRCTLPTGDLITGITCLCIVTPLPLPSQASPCIAIMEILSLSSSSFISKAETCQTCISYAEKQHQSVLSTNL